MERLVLLQLREYHSHNTLDNSSEQPVDGEVVLLRSDNKLRGFWKLVKVQQTLKGRDGQIRSAVLSIPSKGGNIKLLGRPLKYSYVPFGNWS